jgi:hypothetical protein
MIQTINNVNREVSRALSIDEDIVKKVNAYYWKHGVKEAVSSGLHTSVRLKNIGTLVTSRQKTNNKIATLIREIRYFQSSTKEFKKKTREEYIEDRLSSLRLLLVRRNELAHIYIQNQTRINDKINSKLLKVSLGEQTPDTTGDSEQITVTSTDQEDGSGETLNM